jgi:lipoprotein-anchoring transpeptidase ErfK/SrfK
MNQRWLVIIIIVAILGAAGIAIAQFHKSSPATKEAAQMSASINQLLEEATKYEADGEKLKVKDTYAKIVNEYPEYEKVEEIQGKLGELNISIITSNYETPQTVVHEVKSGDSLGKIAKQYNTTKELIKKKNSLKSDVIRIGERLRIWTAPFSITVDKSQNVMELKSGDELVKIYNVSTGTNNSTPVGIYKIATKIPNPVWFKAGGEPVPAESPDNQLGSRWMGFDVNPHYGIHGTIHPDKIGEQATAGCVRMRNAEVEELFDIVPAGTVVTIKD